MRGVAFKVTYNDGGAAGGLVGYRGTCTRGTMSINTDGGAVWCSQKKNPCRAYVDGGFKGRAPSVATDGPCYEATLLSRSPFRFGAGFYHNGPNKGSAMGISQVQIGDIAFLTTVRPEQRSDDRFIFGLFRVGKLYETDEWGNVVESDGTVDIVLPDPVAITTRYWDFQSPNADGSRFWGSGLHRYMSPEVTQRLLDDLLARLEDTDQREDMISALGVSVRPRANVAPLLRRGGPGGTGEGEAHRALKELVAADPTLVGLPKASKARVEYVFANTLDRVDIKFDLPDGSAAIVEIETTCPLPGAHQCVKYRALHHVERGERLDDPRVQAILVAYDFDAESRDLAKSYGIKLVAIAP